MPDTRKTDRYRRRARIWFLEPGDPGPIPVTKVGGAPWWPAGVDRPRCDRNHTMSFMAQILLGDVPGLEAEGAALLSFHYCTECAYEGRMAWGWTERGRRGYDVSVFDPYGALSADGRGVVAEDPLGPHLVRFADRIEEIALGPDDFDYLPELRQWVTDGIRHGIISKVGAAEPDVAGSALHGDTPPEDARLAARYAQLAEFRAPGNRSKLGGWPAWVQNPELPRCDSGETMIFVAQIDWVVGAAAPWGGGGYAYLFAAPRSCGPRAGELVISTT